MINAVTSSSSKGHSGYVFKTSEFVENSFAVQFGFPLINQELRFETAM